MAKLNATTKKAQNLIHNYEYANASELWQVYDNYSYAKQRAFEWCKERMHELDGYGFRICTFNTFQFTCAFKFMFEGEEWLQYHTASYTYNIKL